LYERYHFFWPTLYIIIWLIFGLDGEKFKPRKAAAGCPGVWTFYAVRNLPKKLKKPD